MSDERLGAKVVDLGYMDRQITEMMNLVYMNVERQMMWDEYEPSGRPDISGIDEQVVLSMEPSKLYQIAYSLDAIELVWKILDPAAEGGVDVSRFVECLPRPADHEVM